jgi:hypothetical protein
MSIHKPANGERYTNGLVTVRVVNAGDGMRLDKCSQIWFEKEAVYVPFFESAGELSSYLKSGGHVDGQPFNLM